MARIADRKMMRWVHDDIQYYEHQVVGIRKMARMKSVLLADDMGLGKSLQTLTVFAIDLEMGWSSKMIIVCPATLKGNWADEIEKFTEGIDFMVLNGTPVKRSLQLGEFGAMTGPKILVVNYEQVKPHVNELNSIGFDMAVFDEAHYIKSPKSQRTKAAHALAARRNFLLSGTPLLNHVNELWSILHKIDPNRFPKYWQFVNRYCVFGGYEDRQIVGVKNEIELRGILDEYMLRRMKKDVLDLPDVQIIQRRVDLSPEQLKLYKKIEDELELPTVHEVNPQIIENALTKFLRLKQVCGTTKPFTGKDDSNKLDLACEDDLEILDNGRKVVVFTQFRDVQAAYVERMSDKGYPVYQLHGDVKMGDRQPTVKAWSSEPGAAVLCCMLQVAGVGLNMTASRDAAFLDKLFTPGANQQAIDRLNRIGADETQPIQVREYITRGTIENRVEEILKGKAKVFGDIIESDPKWKQRLYAALMEEDV